LRRPTAWAVLSNLIGFIMTAGNSSTCADVLTLRALALSPNRATHWEGGRERNFGRRSQNGDDLMKAASKIAICLLAASLAALAGPADAQAPRPWLVPELLAAAKSEGSTLIIYASMNEEEALPYWSLFEGATGIKVNFVRMSDSAIRARIAIEHRARQRSWDLVASTPVYRLGEQVLPPFDPPQAKDLIPQARDPNKRWYGYSGNYNAPAYNTAKVKAEELPRTYDEFAQKKQWAGKVAIDATDTEWLAGLYAHFGEERGGK